MGPQIDPWIRLIIKWAMGSHNFNRPKHAINVQKPEIPVSGCLWVDFLVDLPFFDHENIA